MCVDQEKPCNLSLAYPHYGSGPEGEIPAPETIMDINDKVVARCADVLSKLVEVTERRASRQCNNTGKVWGMLDEFGKLLFDHIIDLAVGETAAETS